MMASDGFANTRIAREVGVSPATVSNWRERFSEDGLKHFWSVRQGRGRKPSIPQGKVEEIVRLTLHETPPGATHWNCRTMAARAGVSPATVQRIWAARGLQPHRVETFKLSGDPRFEENVGNGDWSGGPALAGEHQPGADCIHTRATAPKQSPGAHLCIRLTEQQSGEITIRHRLYECGPVAVQPFIQWHRVATCELGDRVCH